MISIVKGVALGNGGLAIAHYVALAPKLDVDLTAPGMIGVSLAAVVVTYNGTLVGTLLTSWARSWVDTTLPLLVGLLEFLMFSTVQFGTNRLVLEKWVAVLTIWALVVTTLLWQVRRRVPAAHGSDGISELYAWYRRTLRTDIFIALAFLIIAVLFFVALAWLVPASYLLRGIGLSVALSLLIFGSASHESRRRTACGKIDSLKDG